MVERRSPGVFYRSDRLRKYIFLSSRWATRPCVRKVRVIHDRYNMDRECRVGARSSGTYLRYRDKIAKPDGLIVDDMGMRRRSSTEAQDLCEMLEERSVGKSTVFTTQLPLEHWSEVTTDPVICDAIGDRLEHAASKSRSPARVIGALKLANLPARKRKTRCLRLRQ